MTSIASLERGRDGGSAKLAALGVLNDAFSDRIGADPKEAQGWVTTYSRWLIDAVLCGDSTALEASLRSLGRHTREVRTKNGSLELVGMLKALADVSRAGADRTAQQAIGKHLDPHSWAARMLLAVVHTPALNSSQLRTQLGVSESQISRSGRMLIERGLVQTTKEGRYQSWHATPRGAETATMLVRRQAHQ